MGADKLWRFFHNCADVGFKYISWLFIFNLTLAAQARSGSRSLLLLLVLECLLLGTSAFTLPMALLHRLGSHSASNSVKAVIVVLSFLLSFAFLVGSLMYNPTGRFLTDVFNSMQKQTTRGC